MDSWDFKRWRKKTGYTQVEAGEKLGLSRAAVQLWENEIRPVPRTVELACGELWRRWKQRPEFGPVTLLYADDTAWEQAPHPDSVLLLQSERYTNNERALQRAGWLMKTMSLIAPLIVEDDGNVIWSGPDLLRECEARKDNKAGGKPCDSCVPSTK